jgi:hypothetical protein
MSGIAVCACTKRPPVPGQVGQARNAELFTEKWITQ